MSEVWGQAMNHSDTAAGRVSELWHLEQENGEAMKGAFYKHWPGQSPAQGHWVFKDARVILPKWIVRKLPAVMSPKSFQITAG